MSDSLLGPERPTKDSVVVGDANVTTVRAVPPPNDVLVAFQRHLSNTLNNWDLQRPYTASLAVRTEGFTEEWGQPNTLSATGTAATATNAVVEPSVFSKEGTTNSAMAMNFSTVRLVQYRPAWLEQLVLRVGRLSHVVVNSPYAVIEATGPLPYLQVLNGTFVRRSSSTSKVDLPAMVGRYSMGERSGSVGTDHANANAILSYLKQYHDLDLDRDISRQQEQQSVLFASLLRETLQPCLIVLRYLADPDAWEQIYRPQCLAAASGATSMSDFPHSLFRSLLGGASWQVWSERVHELSLLTQQQRSYSLETCLASVRRAYTVFEGRLQDSTYLLGTTLPSTVDCALWDHLMHALSDIHLVVVLADFPALVRFVQNIWNRYQFGSGVDDGGACGSLDDSLSLTVWNLEENISNPFNHMPLLQTPQSPVAGRYHTALQLMEQLATVHQNLYETLLFTKEQRTELEALNVGTPDQKQSLGRRRQRRFPFTTWHRWRMGGAYYNSQQYTNTSSARNASASATTTTGTEELARRREYTLNDEIWIASVAATTLALLLSFGLAGIER
jgi:Glutathione S-transferase, C-terminal domain